MCVPHRAPASRAPPHENDPDHHARSDRAWSDQTAPSDRPPPIPRCRLVARTSASASEKLHVGEERPVSDIPAFGDHTHPSAPIFRCTGNNHSRTAGMAETMDASAVTPGCVIYTSNVAAIPERGTAPVRKPSQVVFGNTAAMASGSSGLAHIPHLPGNCRYNAPVSR